MQQRRDKQRGQPEPEKKRGDLLQANIAPAPLGRRSLHRFCDAGRDIGAVGKTHQGPNEDQRDQACRQAARANQHGKGNQGADEHLAATDPIGKAAHEQRRDAPGNRKGTGNRADIPVIEREILRDDRKQGRDHETVQPHEPERESQYQYSAEFQTGLAIIFLHLVIPRKHLL